jgi:hypothetical protein
MMVVPGKPSFGPSSGRADVSISFVAVFQIIGDIDRDLFMFFNEETPITAWIVIVLSDYLHIA